MAAGPAGRVVQEGQAGPAFRCSAASRELAEPVEGTASTVRAFLLVEAPGPWGVDVVRDARMDEEVRHRLAQLESSHRVRPLLIRRHAKGAASDGVRLFAAHVHSEKPWLETVVLDDVRELLDLDLEGLGGGVRPGLAAHDDPVFLVCTHGRHDACCAEQGRPVAAAMTEVAPEQSWEVSHIGGDRFAANVLVLPHGLYYGRLSPQDVPTLVEDTLAGRLDLEHLRGRSSYPFSVQAAEIHLRKHLGHLDIAPLELEGHTRHGTQTRAVFVVDGQRWEVRLHTDLGAPRPLTCRAIRPSAGAAHRLLGLTSL